ncbi:MAG: DUF2262 domain-containing protein [Pirellulaceae bacterium]|jgi:hypothetical protein|nr:DUF2262 domain-containing protein [Pirellulaceae bacterium]
MEARRAGRIFILPASPFGGQSPGSRPRATVCDCRGERSTDAVGLDTHKTIAGFRCQEDDGSTVSREQFEARIVLRSITILPDGQFDVEYDDGNLFFGHDIVATGRIGSSKRSAGIQG